MTIVRFPTKVRLTLVEGEDCEPLVAAAVECADAALSRAVRRATALHLVRDARPDPRRRPCIDVRLSGADLPPGVATRLRAELTALAAARAAELSSRPDDVVPAGPRELGPNDSATEQLDETRLVADRWNPVDDAYLVPSYGGQGAAVALPVTGGASSRGTAGQAAQPVRLQLVNMASREMLQFHIARYFRGAAPTVFVAIYRDAGRPVTVLLRVTPDGVVDGWRVLGYPAIYQKPTGEGGGKWHEGGAPLDVDGIEFLRDAETPAIRAQIREDMWVEVLRREGHGLHLSDEKLRVQARRIVARMPDPGGITSYYWLLSRGVRQTLMEFPQGHPFIGTLPLAVFTETVSEGGGSAGADETDVPLPYDQLSWFEPDPAHAFLGEPPVEFWPPGISAYLSDLIADIAAKLDMAPSRFPGMFCIAADVKVRNEARRLGPLAGSGTEGDSPRMTAIRRMASAFTPLMQLQLFYLSVIGGAGQILPPPLRHNVPSWMLHFHEEHVPRRDEAVAALFVATCQDILLDVLETSHVQILARQQNFAPYMTVTRALILLILVDDPELTELRTILLDGPGSETGAGTSSAASSAGGDKVQTWYDSTRLVVGALGQVDVETSGPPQRGRVRYAKDGPQVQDSVGRWWTRGELDSVLAGGRQQAFAIDPLLEKVADLPDTVEQLRSAGAANVDTAFAALLKDLRTENEAKTRDVRDDIDIAFGLATFKEAAITSNAAIGAELSGLHAQADAALRPLFTGEGEHAYVAGMRFLVGSELGKAGFLEFFNLVGLTAIAIFCPPAAFAIGAVEAMSALDTAVEHRGIQRAMLGGDQILTKAQAEAELWGAAIGAALIFIPEVPGMVRGASSGVGSVVRGEARQAATVAGRQLVKQAALHLAELAAEDLLRVFVAECVKGYVINLAIDGAISRFTEAVAREVTVTGHASVTDVPRLIGDAISGPPAGQQ